MPRTRVPVRRGCLGGKITLSGNNASRLFQVDPGATLTLYNITIRNGYSGSGDGGIYKDGGNPTLKNTLLATAAYSTNCGQPARRQFQFVR